MTGILLYARALGWLRWRLFLNAFKGTKRRDALERVSRAGSAIAPIILAVFFIPAFLASCALSLLGGWAVGQHLAGTPEIVSVVRWTLGIATAVILFIPAVRTAKGPTTNLVRLALLPMPRKILHVADLLAGITDPWIALLVPVMLLFPVGMVIGGEPLGGLIALLAGIALLGAFLALESCVSSLLTLLYRDRRRGEVVTLIVLLVLSFSGLLPMMISRGFDEGRRERRERERAAARAAPEAAPHDSPEAAPDAPPAPSVTASRATRRKREVSFNAALSFLPSELYGRALYEPLRGRTGIGLLGLLGVAGMGGLLYGLSWTTYRRLLDSPENISPRRGARAEPRVWRLPGLGSAASAVALAQVRLVLRTVHGKMAVYFTPVFILVAGFMLNRLGRREVGLFGGDSLWKGPLIAYGLAAFALFAPQRFLLNMFAVDGAGLTLTLLSPVSERELVVGKSAGLGILTFVPMAIITVVVAAFSPPAPIALWVTVVAAAVSAYLILAPASALLSAVFPKATDMNRLSGGASNPNGIASMFGFVLTWLSCGPPALVATLVFLATGRPILVLLGTLAWTGIAAGLSYILIQATARIVAARRENLALVAQGR